MTATPPAETARRFGRHAAVYLASSLLARGLAIILTPIYTRVMSPEDFAVVAVANALTAVLTIVIGLALYGAIPRLYYDYDTEAGRRRFLGTMFVATLGFAVLAGLLLQALGSAGLLDVFETVRFHPHLELVVWTAVFSNVLTLPTVVYTVLEQPNKVAFLNIGSGLLQIGTNILLVAVLRQGAVGVLRAGLYSAGLMAALSVVLMLRMSTIAFSWRVLRPALVYSLPLVPHLMANWALGVSDRLVLERFVSGAELARFSLGYLLSTGVSVVAASMTTPVAPAANRLLGDPTTAKTVPPLGTYALFGTFAAALLASVNARELVSLLGPPAYREAAAIVPWVVGGAALQGVYLVWSVGTWYSKRTGVIPLVTLASVAVNLGINIVFIPKYGIMAAAISTTIGYAFAAALHGLLAQRLHPIPWEYSRWAKMALACAVAYVSVRAIVIGSIPLALLVKSAASLGLFVAALVVLGAARREDVAKLISRFRSTN